MSLTPDQKAKRQKLKDDFAHYAKHCLKIRDEAGSVVPLVMNESQQFIHNRIEQQLRETGKVRAIVLKGRQTYCSTYVEGRFYWKVSHRQGVRAFILTHEQSATDNLFEMADRYHRHCLPKVRPHVGASSSKELYFDTLDSGYKVGTAGSKGTGRSNTIQYFHGSEVAFWPNPEGHFSGVIQAVPDMPGTEIILESTANGVGGLFYKLCMDAMEGIGDYILIFVPWFWMKKYRRDAKGFAPTDAEKALAKHHGLTNEQLAWRRAKIYELKSEALFHQEYPSTPEEAFIFSGRPVFDAIKLIEAHDECFTPLHRAEIVGGGLNKREDGRLRVWEPPRHGERYVIGADVAEGLEHGDYSCADVLAASDGRQVAQWHGHIDPDLFGDVLNALGMHYHRALLGVERNNHGLATLTNLRNRGYPNLYSQQDIERRSEGYETKKFGWLTTAKSKVKIIDQMVAEVRDGQLRVFCADTIREMGSFVIHEDGSLGAKPGMYDDRVIARAIAGEMLLVMPRRNRTK